MVRIGMSGESPEINNKKQQSKSSTQAAKNASVFNGADVYKAKSGDNFFKIANAHKLTIHQLAEANGWQYDNKTKTMRDAKGQPVKLTVGLKIKTKISSSDVPPPKSSNVDSNRKETISYKVKSGENPSVIADKYQVSLRQLAAENGWEVRTIKDGKKERIAVFEAGKEVVLDKAEEIKIPPSVTASIGMVKNHSEIKKLSGMSDGMLEIFVKFEGNPDNNFKPYTVAKKDGKGTPTIGYGYTKGVKVGQKWSTERCYQQLVKDYLQTQEDIRVTIGDEVFNKMPKSLKEGLIDLVFNKGFAAIDIDKFKAAVIKEDFKSATEQLIYTKSMVDDKEMNGLYKRSLGRLAHVYSGLSLEDKDVVKSVIDGLYNESKGKVSDVELATWWKPEEGSAVEKTEKGNKGDSLKSEYIVQEGDSSLASISRKLGTGLQQLMVLNRHLAPDYKIKVGDKININAQTVVEAPKEIKTDKSLSAEIVNIKNMDLDSQERLQKTNELVDAYAKKFQLSEVAVNLLKAEAKKEYESWFWVDTDKMTAMTDILDASDAESLYKSINGAIDESDEAKKFAAEVLNKKINKDNIAELISLSGGSKNFIKMMKKVGGLDILKHSFLCLTEESKEQQSLLIQYNKAIKEEDYSEIQRVFDNVLAKSAKEISDNLNDTLVDDDDLNAILYKYQIQRVNSENIIEVLRSNDIIAGICEADNERSICKEEIQKLFDILDKNYDLDDSAKENFLKVFEEEFRDRSVWNPSTWWIGTGKVSEAFNKLLVGDLEPKNLRKVIAKELGWSEADMNPAQKTSGKVKPLIQTFEPTGSGVLDGKKIQINAGHGGYNPNTKDFDIGAEGIKDLEVTEWMMNRLMSQRVIEKLQALGAEVVLTAGHFEVVSYKDYGTDLLVSLHSDSRDKTSSKGTKIYAHPKDAKDEKLALNILENYIESDGVTNLRNLNFKKKDGTWYRFDKQFSPEETPDSMQANMLYGSKQVLRKNDRAALDEPAVLVEFCNINDEKDLRNIVLGKYGEEIADAIVKGIIGYWE